MKERLLEDNISSVRCQDVGNSMQHLTTREELYPYRQSSQSTFPSRKKRRGQFGRRGSRTGWPTYKRSIVFECFWWIMRECFRGRWTSQRFMISSEHCLQFWISTIQILSRRVPWCTRFGCRAPWRDRCYLTPPHSWTFRGERSILGGFLFIWELPWSEHHEGWRVRKAST